VSVNKVMASLRCLFPVARHVELTNCIACELHVTLTQQPTNITYMRQHIHTLDLVRITGSKFCVLKNIFSPYAFISLFKHTNNAY
jgi:hypothetical protein